MRTLILAIGTILFVFSFMPSGTASHTNTLTYVIGDHFTVQGTHFYVPLCTEHWPTNPAQLPATGAACRLDLPARTVTITVRDFNDQPVGFFWKAYTAGDNACGAANTGTGSTTVTTPVTCAYVQVAPDLGSVSGTITVTAA